MKFCAFCGKQLDDNAIFCGNCGKATYEQPQSSQPSQSYQTYQSYQSNPYGDNQGYQNYQSYQAPAQEPKREPSGLANAARIIMLISTIIMGIQTLGIALIWCLPMMRSYKKNLENGTKVTTKFKVCTLIFVSTVAGILMLCDPKL